MNKCICAAALLCGSALTAHAQTGPGTILLGGGLNFSNSQSEGTSSSLPTTAKSEGFQFNVTPRVGYFITDKLAVGLQMGYSHSISEQSSSGYTTGSGAGYYYKSKGNGYQVGPFVRYYKMVGEKTGFFAQVAAAHFRSRSENDYTEPRSFTNTDKIRGYYANLTPGFVFFPTAKLGLEATFGSLGYTRSTLEFTEERPFEATVNSKRTTSEFGANFALTYFSLGASFHL